MTDAPNKYEDAFNAAPQAADNDITGKQDLEVVAVTMAASKAGNPMVKWHFKVVGGEFNGRHAWKNQNAVTPDNWCYLRKDFTTCHVKIAKAADLGIGANGWDGNQPKLLEQFTGMKVAATFKKRGDNVDIYIDKLLDVAPEAPKTDKREDLPSPPF